MSCKLLKGTPMAADIGRVEKEQLNQSPSENECQILRFNPSPNFKLPDGWVVETKPRPSKPNHTDKYYYEPGTGKKFRSLLAVQRHLAGETKHYVISKRMISENEDYYCYEPSTGKKYRSLLAVQRHLTEETKHCVTPERMISENKDTPTKTDSQRKFNLRKEDRVSNHNLSRPPEKVSWVLSGPGGFWSPSVDDTIVPESVKLKWSEAFVQSIHHGVVVEDLIAKDIHIGGDWT